MASGDAMLVFALKSLQLDSKPWSSSCLLNDMEEFISQKISQYVQNMLHPGHTWAITEATTVV